MSLRTFHSSEKRARTESALPHLLAALAQKRGAQDADRSTATSGAASNLALEHILAAMRHKRKASDLKSRVPLPRASSSCRIPRLRATSLPLASSLPSTAVPFGNHAALARCR